MLGKDCTLPYITLLAFAKRGVNAILSPDTILSYIKILSIVYRGEAK